MYVHVNNTCFNMQLQSMRSKLNKGPLCVSGDYWHHRELHCTYTRMKANVYCVYMPEHFYKHTYSVRACTYMCICIYIYIRTFIIRRLCCTSNRQVSGGGGGRGGGGEREGTQSLECTRGTPT